MYCVWLAVGDDDGGDDDEQEGARALEIRALFAGRKC